DAVSTYTDRMTEAIRRSNVEMRRAAGGAAAGLKQEFGQFILEQGGVDAFSPEQLQSLVAVYRERREQLAQLESLQQKSQSSASTARTAQASASDQWLASLNEQYGDLLANQEREIALYSEIGRSAAMAYDLATGSLSSLSEAQKQDLQQGAESLVFLDDHRAIAGVRDTVREEHANKQVERFSEMEQFGIQAARNIQSELGQGLYDVLGGQFDGIADRFSDMLRRMTAELMASQLLNALGQWAQGYTGAGAGFVNAFGNAMGGG